MPGSVASSPRRTPEMTWTSPCRHSKWWGQSWDLSEPFWGRRGGWSLLGSGSIAHSEGTSYFGGRPYPYDARRPHDARSPHPRSPPTRVLTVLGLLAGGIGSLTAQHRGQVVMGALGGYSRLYLGANSPYHSELNAIHGGLGERIFFVGDRVALRLEARAYYRGPGGGMTSPHWVGHFTGTVGLSFLLGGGGETKSY